MILEAALLTVRPDLDAAFAAALAQARPLIAASPGFHAMEVRPCLEQPRRYLLLVWWERLTDHTEGFRGIGALRTMESAPASLLRSVSDGRALRAYDRLRGARQRFEPLLVAATARGSPRMGAPSDRQHGDFELISR